MSGHGPSSGPLPEAMHQGFSDSMAQSLMLPAAVLLLGMLAVLLFAKPQHMQRAPTAGSDDLEGLRS
ncbi:MULTISPECIES: hypothetical protein [unclassified Kribbella]|uniref:hypothetical protein n=1 Tax=unclassified Kribbella TaxID=2644121 RepID=UPI003017BC5E